MVDIQSPTTEIRRGKKKKKKKEGWKLQGKNIMACPIPKGGHKTEMLRRNSPVMK